MGSAITKSEANKSLASAIKLSDLDAVKVFLRHADPNTQVDGKYPLHLAVENGNLDILKELIQAKADPNVLDMDSETPLHVAARRGEVEVAKCLVSSNVDVGKKCTYGWTALHHAAASGRLDMVKYLATDAKADPNATDNGGYTPLHLAVKDGEYEVVKWLITDGGADPNTESLTQCIDDITPLLSASSRGHLDIVKCLVLDGKVDPSQTRVRISSPTSVAASIEIKTFLEEECGKWEPAESQYGILHRAAAHGRVEDVKWLLSNTGLCVDARASYGSTPLHSAASVGELFVVQCLVERHADVHAKEHQGWTPLHRACSRGRLEVVKWLVLEGKADVNMKDNLGRTPLHVAIQRGQKEVMDWLMTEGGADKNPVDSNGVSPIFGRDEFACGVKYESWLW